jgi:hypothetical protein
VIDLNLLLGWLKKDKPAAAALIRAGVFVILVVTVLCAVLIYITLLGPSDAPADRLTSILHGPAK